MFSWFVPLLLVSALIFSQPPPPHWRWFGISWATQRYHPHIVSSLWEWRGYLPNLGSSLSVVCHFLQSSCLDISSIAVSHRPCDLPDQHRIDHPFSFGFVSPERWYFYLL